MDSVSQLVLGAGVGMAVMGRRTALWKAALWGGVAGTLPDLDAFIDFGDAVRNMTYHRAESHALFWQTLISPLLALAAAKLHGEMALFKRWWLAIWLALITHPLLDFMTVYGTQLWLPFTEQPFGMGSIFIIDPLYTLPLLVGVGVALALRNERGLKWNAAGLVLSTLYLAWGVGVQAHVRGIAHDSLPGPRVDNSRVLVTPTAFNSILWRVVVMHADGYDEGYYSLLDAERRVHFKRYPRDAALHEQLRNEWTVARMAWFSRGFFRMWEADGKVYLADLRMGREPNYIFTFLLAERGNPSLRAVTPVQVGSYGDRGQFLSWTWQRMLGSAPTP